MRDRTAMTTMCAKGRGRAPLLFVQAEDGIRDATVTGFRRVLFRSKLIGADQDVLVVSHGLVLVLWLAWLRSGERRGGEEGRSRWGPAHLKKKKQKNKQSHTSQHTKRLPQGYTRDRRLS